MGARQRRSRKHAQQAASMAFLGALTRMCPDCGSARREVLGPDDLTADQRLAYAEVVTFIGQPTVMHVCDGCGRIGFVGAWG